MQCYIIHEIRRTQGTVLLCCTIGVGSNINRSELSNIATSTGGRYYSLNNSEITDVMIELAINKDVYLDSDGDGLSDYHEKKLASGEIKFGMGDVKLTLLGLGTLTYNFKGLSHLKADSDKDGLLDGEELFIREVNISGEPAYYCFMLSNPVKTNSDGDSLDDLLDNAPLDKTKHSFLIYETLNTDRSLKSYTNSSNPDHYPQDIVYGEMSKDEILQIDCMSMRDFGSEYEKKQCAYELDMERFFIKSTLFSGDMSDVALDMVEHFFGGTGADYRNDALVEAASNHINVMTYKQEISKIINNLIKENSGDISIAEYDSVWADFVGPGYRNSTYMVEHMKDSNDNVIVYQPKFDTREDWTSGLGLCVHDTYGNRIEVTSFKYDEGVYTYTLRFTLYDIFGLDESDITGGYDDVMGAFFGELEGFRSWFILQHYNKFKGEYKPYISYMEFEQTFCTCP